MPAEPLHHRVALITGASAGIGRAIAVELARRGCRVVVNARRREMLETLVADLNRARAGAAVGIVGDAAEQSVIDEMFGAAEAKFGAAPDIVVVNAGRGLSGSVTTSDPAQWEDMIRINVAGTARLMRAAAERMLKMVQIPEGEAGARAGQPWLARPRDIVVLGSNVGRHISPFSSMYGSTKFAANSLAEALRRELAPKGIRVSLLEPGIVRSEFQEVAGYDPKAFGAFMDKVGPVLEPEDIARTVAFIVEQPAHVHLNDIVIRPTRQDYP